MRKASLVIGVRKASLVAGVRPLRVPAMTLDNPQQQSRMLCLEAAAHTRWTYGRARRLAQAGTRPVRKVRGCLRTLPLARNMTSAAASSCAQLLTALGVDVQSAVPLRLQLIAAGNAPEKSDTLVSLGRALRECVDTNPSDIDGRLRKIYVEQPGLFAARVRSRSPRRATEPPFSAPTPPEGATFANSWEFRPRGGRTYVAPAPGRRQTSLALHVGEEWIRVTFAPKWTEETIAKGFAKLKFQVYAEGVAQQLRALDSWAKGELAASSREMLGREMTVEDIEREGVYRSPLWVGNDPTYPPGCEVGLVTRGPEAYLTRFSFEKATGEIEHASSASEAVLGLHRECTDTRTWVSLRFRVAVRPESVYTFTNREGVKIAGINLVAVSVVVRRPEAAGAAAASRSPAARGQSTLSFPPTV